MDIRNKIKETVKGIDPTAQVILFGSRARGDARQDSDWDVLILVDRPTASFKDEQIFRHKLFDIQLETGESIFTMMHTLNDWNTIMTPSSLYKNISREGITL